MTCQIISGVNGEEGMRRDVRTILDELLSHIAEFLLDAKPFLEILKWPLEHLFHITLILVAVVAHHDLKRG